MTAAAASLLALASKLRTAVSHPDSSALFRHLADEIRRFESAAQAAGAAPDVVLASRYSLCTLLDEVVLNTPWGSQSVWINQTLLNLFHKEGWGGEKFFQIVERVMQQPASNLDLLELLYRTPRGDLSPSICALLAEGTPPATACAPAAP